MAGYTSTVFRTRQGESRRRLFSCVCFTLHISRYPAVSLFDQGVPCCVVYSSDLYFEIFKYSTAVRNCIKYFSYLLIRGKFLLTCSYIDELRNGRKFKCEDKP